MPRIVLLLVLLIAELASINRKNVSRISWVDVKTGQSEALYSGDLALYLANSDVIVYDDGGKLFAVSLAGGSDSDPIISHRLHQLSSMIEVSNDTVLFETNDAGNRRIHSFDALTRKLQLLDRLSGVCRLDGAVWIDDLEQLACRERTSEGNEPAYILASLDGDVSGQEKSAIWVHNIQSGENQRLAKNQNLGASVVYTDF